MIKKSNKKCTDTVYGQYGHCVRTQPKKCTDIMYGHDREEIKGVNNKLSL